MNDTHTGIDLAALMASEFHELKNQLGQLTLMLDEQGMAHPELAPHLSAPRLLCQRIVDRLVQVLTLYKSDQQRMSLNVDAISPADFIDQIASQAASLSGGRLKIVTRAEDAPPFWFLDRYLVEMAMLNAVHNALQYARETIEISAGSADEGLCLRVRDDSAGYPPRIIENQGHDPGRNATGTGLGLYFAHAIAAVHENRGRIGRLTLANDNGAVFTLWLP
jgi:signal transduction histidine kinase